MRIWFLMIMTALVGCTSLIEDPDAGNHSVTAVIPQREEPKVTRTLGSLWSNGSSWNSVYSATSSRVEGDLLEIQLTDPIKTRIQTLRQRMIFEKYGEGVIEATPGQKPPVEARNPDSENAPDATRTVSVDPLPATIQAVIKDVGQRGIYKISAFETLRVGDDEPRLILEGLVRDKDIDADDKLSGDSIYGLKIELGSRVTQNQTEQKARTEGSGNVSW